MILHITSRTDWERGIAQGTYTADSLATEGFIHCSTVEQIIATAGRFYRGRAGLVLLVIDPARLAAPVVYEDLYDAGQDFPHIYGPLELTAVVDVVDFPPNADGTFALPAALR